MKGKIVKKSQDWLSDGEQATRNIWLAGLGVYSKSIEEVQLQRDKGNTLFDELVAKGREVEASARSKVEDNVETVNRNLESRVQSLFGRLRGVAPDRIDEINDKLDQLTELVEKLDSKR